MSYEDKTVECEKKIREPPNVTKELSDVMFAESDNGTVTCEKKNKMKKELSNVMLKLHNVRMKMSNVMKKKETTKYDKSTSKCDVGTTQYEDETIKCEKIK